MAKFNPFTILLRMFDYLKEDIKTNAQIKESLWRKEVSAWVGGTLEWLNNPTVLPPSDTLEEIFCTVIVAEGYHMLTGGHLQDAHRSIHNLLEYILRSEGKVNITCVPTEGEEQQIARKVSHPACRKSIVNGLMDFSKPLEDMYFYQLCSDVSTSDIKVDNCPQFTALLPCGYLIDHSLTFPDDIRLCDNCLDLYYMSALTKRRSVRAEYSIDTIQGFMWLKRTIQVLFQRRELDRTNEQLRKEVAFVMWFFGLVKTCRMETEHDVADHMLDLCIDKFRRRVEQKDLK